ncbi:esterase/lipase family protein [Fluviispira multicolorata]|uniref:triacylglycerol lipase n=1 Tax=Fluviispira multicolorata TaxID=2654512 RepID=A0A833JF46_9BACT|nr:lipase [Fluviispira multicolorata]KAB8033544.1 lipase [Fluviispira multicolorata]
MTFIRISLFIFLLIFSIGSYATNRDPLVLVHGFSGWGRHELLGYKYWGGFNDLQEDLKVYNGKVFTASVGKFSSNYDRAVDLYAQIKGGCADYGEAHAKRFKHARFGRCYPEPLYPEWDQNHKIHLLGHSQGGQTIRVLLNLLREGYKEEMLVSSTDVAELFRGNNSWVTSITTVSTPNNGTSLTHLADVFLPTSQFLITSMAAIASALGVEPFLDFKLEQWNLVKGKNESIPAFLKRAYQSYIWNTNDISKWDLSPEGAHIFNTSDKEYDDTYYFSYSTQSTAINIPFTNCQISILTFLSFPANAIGCFTHKYPGKIEINEKWLANDGVVNTISMASPFNKKRVFYDGTVQKGIWNDMGIKHGWDHLEIIGAVPNPIKPYWKIKEFYEQHLNLLHSL